MRSKNSHSLALLIAGFVLWRFGLLLLSAMADFFLPYAPSFPYAQDVLAQFGLPRWLYSFANFDGVHYLTIMAKGYVGTGLIQAFFPLFPLLARSLTWLGLSDITAALLVSNAAALALVIELYRLARLDMQVAKAQLAVATMLVFPTAFFLGSVYNESLFMLLVIGSFWFARQQRWLLAGLCAAAASATRVVGVALVPALLLEVYLSYTDVPLRQLWQRRDIHRGISSIIETFVQHKSAVVAVLLGTTGLLTYMGYLSRIFGDSFYFLHVQAEFGANRSETLVTYPQVVWRYLKILATARPFNWSYFASVQEFVAGTVGAVALAAGVGKVRSSYLVFALGAFIIPTLTGTFSSMPRYLLICFPLYFVIARLPVSRPAILSYLAFSLVLLIINTILFIQGFWVA